MRPPGKSSRANLPKTRGQVAIEYILLLGGILVLTAVTTVFLQENFFRQQAPGIQNKSATIKDLSKQLETPASSTPPFIRGFTTPTPGTGLPSPPAGTATATPAISVNPAASITPPPSTTPPSVPTVTPVSTPNACTTQSGECRLQGACPSGWKVADPDGVAASACGAGKLQTYECCLVGAPT